MSVASVGLKGPGAASACGGLPAAAGPRWPQPHARAPVPAPDASSSLPAWPHATRRRSVLAAASPGGTGPLNPRYARNHSPQPPAPQAQPHASHPHNHTHPLGSHSHAHPHSHHAHTLPHSAAPAPAGRSAWATPGPLSRTPPGGRSGGSDASGRGPGAVAAQALRHGGAAAPQPSPSDDPRGVAAGAAAAPPASPSSTSASASTSNQRAEPSATFGPDADSAGPREASSTSTSSSSARSPSVSRSRRSTASPSSSPSPSSTKPASAKGATKASPAPLTPAPAAAPLDPLLVERTTLERLYVRDFALVEEQTVLLGPGLNVITGESGSGKSVLVEAFSQVLGAPAPQECVRAPAEVAVVEGTFLLGPPQQAAARALLEAAGLPQKALPPPPGEGGVGAFRLTVRREIAQAPGGGLRSRVFLNGAASSLRLLRELGAQLVDTNGQHSSQSLRDPNTQLALLDRIAGTAPLADAYGAALARLRGLEARLDELDELDDEDERGRLQKLVDAVAKLRVAPGEERELRKALKKMEARRSAVEQCGLVRLALVGEAGAGGVSDGLRTIEAQLNAIAAQEEAQQDRRRGKGPDGAAAAADDEGAEEGEEEEGEEGGGAALMEEALERVAQAKQLLAEADGMVRGYARRYAFSQADHDATAERLQRLERLMRGAGSAGFGGPRGVGSSEELLAAAQEAGAKLAAYYEMEGQRDDWEAQLAAAADEIRRLALELSVRRRAAAAALRGAVEGCLRELAMGGSRFDVRIGWAESRVEGEGLYVGEEEAEEAGVPELGGGTYVLGSRGVDQVEFLLAAGPAEPLRPLAAVASGGESARLMLALKAAPAQAAAAAAAAAAAEGAEALRAQHDAAAAAMAGGGVPIMILDELDSGIGARLGTAVGSILARMTLPGGQGSNSQIICVTHLPQVACYASHHMIVQKEARPVPAPAAAAATSLASAGSEADDAPAAPAAAPAAAVASRVTTTFKALRGFPERCDEVAAMLGLDRTVAEDMLRTAQNQVAAMYGSALYGGATSVAGASGAAGGSFAPQPRSSPGPAAGAAASGRNRSGGGGGSPAPFVVNLAPAMPVMPVTPGDEDADGASAITGSAAAAAAANATFAAAAAAAASGSGHESDGAIDDAELSAQLLAGVEAAAMQHLARMTQHAKAAAAAAAVARDSTLAAAGEAAATATTPGMLTAGVLAAMGTMAGTVAVAGTVAGSMADTVTAMLTPQGKPGQDPAAPPAAAAEGGDPAAAPPAAAAGASWPMEFASAAAKGMKEVAVGAAATLSPQAAASVAAAAEAAVDLFEAAAAVPVPAAERVPAEVAAAREAEALLASVAAAADALGRGEMPNVTLPGAPAAAAAAAPEAAAATMAGAEDEQAAAAPLRRHSPLPYNFGNLAEESGSSSDDDAVAASYMALEHGGVVQTDSSLVAGSSGHDRLSSVEEPPQHNTMPYDAPYDASASQLHDTGDYSSTVTDYSAALSSSSYLYNAHVGASGGRFVNVPLGHENEFKEMFSDIMAFTREDYAGEAMRSHEANLWRALRDSGLA
ncbi:hypothetical protein HYH03_005611 [Edaphochlamys debaryana]|uniref:DNA repair protein RecN n=1 Tax=Edaphochlamys debaryana TaxID=47281 RepID=A0A835Y5I8_9CHLO|nr:hypothetical protein HYH03_005611 [Edaphochlamys debaryana]|eukprot:KAG2496383.1 hypothetical protein HYH03_005611 [Edaphochlamys debaryana]